MDGTGPGGRGPTPVRPAALHLARREPEPKRVVTTLVRVLLLNASHEPLAVVTGRRALVLVVAGKAECVLERSECDGDQVAVGQRLPCRRLSGSAGTCGCPTRRRRR